LTFEYFIADRGLMVMGGDFFALNYGREYGRERNNGRRKIGISGRERSYLAEVLENEFPGKVLFQIREANMKLLEASEVKYSSVRCEPDFKFIDFIDMLRKGGWEFSEYPIIL